MQNKAALPKRLIHGSLLALTILVSYLSNSGYYNGQTMASISAKYENLFTPQGYAFSIWGLIYIALIGFVIFFKLPENPIAPISKAYKAISLYFSLSCIFNMLWVICWLEDYTGLSVLIMILLFLSLLKVSLSIPFYIKALKIKGLSAAMIRYPFQLYSGWVSLALLANLSVYITKLNLFTSTLAPEYWAIGMLTLACLLHLYMLWAKNMPLFTLVAPWTLIAIALKNQPISPLIYSLAISASLVLLASIATQSIYKMIKR